MSTEQPSGESGVFDSVAAAVAELEKREEARGVKPDAEEPEEGVLPADESADETPTEEGEAKEQPEAEEAPKTSIEFDGKQVEIPQGTPPELVEVLATKAKELQADYTRKTQAVADDRRQVDAVKQQTVAQASQLQQTQQALAVMAQSLLGAEPDLSLAQHDPQTYLVQKGLYEQRVGQFRQLMEQGKTLQAQQAQQTEEQQQEYRTRESQALLKAIPDLTKPEKFAEFKSQAIGAGEKYGISADEIAQITDHRLVLALRDLAKYHAQAAQSGELKDKLKNIPPRMGKPGSAAQQTPASQKSADAKREFMKSPRTDRDLRRYLAQTS